MWETWFCWLFSLFAGGKDFLWQFLFDGMSLSFKDVMVKRCFLFVLVLLLGLVLRWTSLWHFCFGVRGEDYWLGVCVIKCGVECDSDCSIIFWYADYFCAIIVLFNLKNFYTQSNPPAAIWLQFFFGRNLIHLFGRNVPFSNFIGILLLLSLVETWKPRAFSKWLRAWCNELWIQFTSTSNVAHSSFLHIFIYLCCITSVTMALSSEYLLLYSFFF